MRKFTKITVALAVSGTLLLTACKENVNGPTPAQSQPTQATSSARSGAASTASPASSASTSSSFSTAQSLKTSASSSERSSSETSTSSAPQSAPVEGFPENPSEASLKYFDDAMSIVDKYLSCVMGSDDEAEQLGSAELDNDLPEDRQKIVKYLLDCAKKGEGYLDELEKLTPTEEMSAFHTGLVSLMSVMREYSDIAQDLANTDMSDDASVDEFNEKIDAMFERFNKKYKEFYVIYPGFGNVLEDGEWQNNGSVTSMYINTDLKGDADRAATKVLTAVTDWARFHEKSALSNAILEIDKTEKTFEVTGVTLDETERDALHKEIDTYFLLPEAFWARIYFNADGISRFVLLSPDGKLDDSELYGGSGFESNVWSWHLSGVTPSGHIIGTCGVPLTAEPQ